jgi:hypothetical protein
LGGLGNLLDGDGRWLFGLRSRIIEVPNPGRFYSNAPVFI